ncbi:MAG: hypothetical protein AAF065_13170 [Verrucomicrobiota bacterium]
MKLDKNNVPEALANLLSSAEKWGIEDDYERAEMLENASVEELEEIVSCIDDVSDEDLFDWLAGDMSTQKNPSKEYIALTCLTMSVDSARIKLSRMK